MLLSAKFIAKDIVGDLLYWPLWWYSRGFARFLQRRRHSIKEFEEDIGLTVWIVNWTKPMYGQYDLAGKIISFIIRTFGIMLKLLMMAFYLLLQVVIVLVWLLAPPFLLWQLLKVLF